MCPDYQEQTKAERDEFERIDKREAIPFSVPESDVYLLKSSGKSEGKD
jgi:hypothetical protein